MNTKLVRPFIVAWACTAALGVAACDNTANRQTSSTASAPPAASNDNQPLTLTGCLMRGDGHNDFILTKANQPAPVGTSGAAGEAGTVERKQLESASRSYRLSGESDELDKLVGHQIRVSGTLADKGDLNAPDKTSGTSGGVNKDREISASDLAKVDVKSVESIADSCESAKNGGASSSRR